MTTLKRNAELGMLLVLVSGCGRALVPSTPVEISVAGTTGTLPTDAWETFPVATLGGGAQTPPQLVVGFNGFAGFSTRYAWAFSADGLSWTTCDAFTAGCGDPGASAPCAGCVPFATGLISGNPATQTAWNGDPAMAASPVDPGVVVSLQLASIATQPLGAIVASIPADAGRTFRSSEFVNDEAPCGRGVEDRPSITWDRGDFPGGFYAVWRHRSVDPGVYGACMRHGSVLLSGGNPEFVWDRSHAVTTRPALGFGIGSLIPVANAGTVTIVYSNTDEAFRCGGTIAVGWRSVVSLDGGLTWEREREIFVSSQPTCIPTATNNRVMPGGTFGFAQAPDGTFYAAFPEDDAAGIRVFISTDGADTWSEFRQMTVGGYLFFPTLSVDDEGRPLLVFHNLNLQGSQVQSWAAWLDTGSTVGPILADGPWPSPAAGNFRDLGDYNGIATFPRGTFPGSGANATFYATWARSDGTTSTAASTVVGAYETLTP